MSHHNAASKLYCAELNKSRGVFYAPPLPPYPFIAVRATVPVASILEITKPTRAQPFVGPLQHQGHASSNTQRYNQQNTRGMAQSQAALSSSNVLEGPQPLLPRATTLPPPTASFGELTPAPMTVNPALQTHRDTAYTRTPQLRPPLPSSGIRIGCTPTSQIHKSRRTQPGMGTAVSSIPLPRAITQA